MDPSTDRHAAIEYFYNGLPVSASQTSTPEWSMFQEFYEDHKDLTPWRTEQMVFSESLRLTGSLDMQYRRADGTIIIADWKRKPRAVVPLAPSSFSRVWFRNVTGSKGITKKAYGGTSRPAQPRAGPSMP